MLEQLSRPLLRLLRVPAEPAPPPGDPRLLRTFRAAPRYLHYKIAAWGLKQLGALAGLLFSYLFVQSITRNIPFGYFGLIEQLLVLAFLAQLPFSFALLRLDFEMRWYMLSDRSLRIRHGILKVSEQTITFANVQNITIRQNPLQRLFGVSTVAVRAAGGGGGSQGKPGGGTDNAHEATFEGVSDAEAIRNLIRERVRTFRDAGLGDPDEDDRGADGAGPASPRQRPVAGVSNGGAAAANAAASRLLEEMRSLRSALQRG